MANEMNSLIQGMEAGARLTAPIAEGMHIRRQREESARQNSLIEKLKLEEHEQRQRLGGLEAELLQENLATKKAAPRTEYEALNREIEAAVNAMADVQTELQKAQIQGDTSAIQKAQLKMELTQQYIDRKKAELDAGEAELLPTARITRELPDGSKATYNVPLSQLESMGGAGANPYGSGAPDLAGVDPVIAEQIQELERQIVDHNVQIHVEGDRRTGLGNWRSRERELEELMRKRDTLYQLAGLPPPGGGTAGTGSAGAGGSGGGGSGEAPGAAASILDAAEETDQSDRARVASPRTPPPNYRPDLEEARRLELGGGGPSGGGPARRQPITETSATFGAHRPDFPEPDPAVKIEEEIAKRQQQISHLMDPKNKWMDNRLRGGIEGRVRQLGEELKALYRELDLIAQ